MIIDRLGLNAAARHPLDPRAVYVLGLATVAGVVLLFTGAEPGSIEALLPKWGVALWAMALVGGSVLTLIGMSRQTVDGVITEQVGSVATGVACVMYASAMILVGGMHALLPASFVLGFGAACFVRWGQLQKLLVEGQVVVDEYHENEGDS